MPEDENRDDRPELKWDEYHMSVAALTAKRSKLENKVGAVIVNGENKILGVGYNGTPLHHPDPGNIVVDAVTNAILFRSVAELKGMIMYTTEAPSAEAASMIVQSRISKLYYMQRNGPNIPLQISEMLAKGKVAFEHFKPRMGEVVVNLAALGDTQPETVSEPPQ